TIYALSSHPGKSAVAVVRISGPLTQSILQRMVPSALSIRPRHALLTKLVHPNDPSSVLDTCLCLWFPRPRSFTGEDMAEFHVHGGTAVVSAVLKSLQLDGVRMAERGEFSRRALDNGKMDLTALEGTADLLNAETEAQRRLAVRQSRGELHQLYEQWRCTLVDLLAQLEAYIDFSEDENIEDDIYPSVRGRASKLLRAVAAHLNDERRGEILRNGIALAIVGPPNSGKSTLLNKLARRQVAIVSPLEGTTRDVVEATLDIGGYPVVVQDTAGLRRSSDIIETEGIRRAVESARAADIRIFMLDVQALASAEWLDLLRLPHTFVVFNKTDTVRSERTIERAKQWAHSVGAPALFISCATNAGWSELVDKLAAHIRGSWESSDKTQMPLTNARHREHLERCMAHLVAFEQVDDVVLAAEELRRAADALGRITGRMEIEDVLDALFGQFCIGK
ncbi:hypothetical protein BX070DRAFT_182692, partial [Coemansia spiralis]